MDDTLRSRREVLTAGATGVLGAGAGSVLALAGCSGRAARESSRPAASSGEQRPSFALPPVPVADAPSLDFVLRHRRSVREFTEEPLTLAQVGRLLWAAQGVTAGWGGRTAPSAGARYPLELYTAMPDRLLHYRPDGHRAQVWMDGDVRGRLADTAASREAVAMGAVVFVVAVVTRRTSARYGSRAVRYVDLEAGHATQSLLLEAVALGLGAVPIGAFDDEQVAREARLPRGCAPRYLVPVGVPA